MSRRVVVDWTEWLSPYQGQGTTDTDTSVGVGFGVGTCGRCRGRYPWLVSVSVSGVISGVGVGARKKFGIGG